MANITFRRKIYEQMLKWKNERNGKTALLIKGARRVGKSTIAEEFARNEYKSYILIDFSNVPKRVTELLEDISDLNFFFLQLQLIFNVNLYNRESVIVFDEIQLQPLARQAIKHLVKDGRYDYIETGSLLSIKKNVKNIVIPSEETRITLNPMDFEEFLWAMNDNVTIPLLKSAYEAKKPLGDAVNRKLLRDFRLYMLVGGMPQSVAEYISTNNLAMVDIVKREILDLYDEDFRKIDPTGRASKLFMSIPSELNKNASRYQVSSVLENSRNDTVAEVIVDMEDSMTINLAYHANDPNVGFALHKDSNRFKMFLADTGLFITLAFKNKSFTENVIYQKLLSNKLAADLGYVYENIVAQMLRSIGDELYYYTFPTESKRHNYEIDFLISRMNKICPIEVKSSGYKTHVSLDEFCNKFSDRISDKYLVYTKDFRKEKDITYLPIYLIPFLKEN